MNWVDRQLPVGDEIFLDHVGFFVSDVEAARSQLAKLGFQVSPAFIQMNADENGAQRPSGTSNCMARLRRGFIEVLAATSETPLAGQLKTALRRYQGLHLIALSHADLATRRRDLDGSGFRMQDIVRIGAPVVAWSVLRPEEGVIPEGRVQFVTCHTPDASWPQGSTAHANGADRITGVLLCVADQTEAGARFGRYLQRQAEERNDYSIVPTDRGVLSFVEPRCAAEILPRIELPSVPYIAALALACNSVAEVRNLLLEQGVTPAYEDDDIVCVHPADALGAYMVFHSSSVTDVWRGLRLGVGTSN